MTPALQLPKERVTLLDPGDVEAYLLVHNWEEDASTSSPTIAVFRYGPSSEVAVEVPRDRGFLDYALRVGDVLQTLAVVERRKVWEVLEDLLALREAPFVCRKPRR
jgi:hypothetical protein